MQQQALTHQRGVPPRDAVKCRRQIRHAHVRLRCCEKCSETQLDHQKLVGTLLKRFCWLQEALLVMKLCFHCRQQQMKLRLQLV